MSEFEGQHANQGGASEGVFTEEIAVDKVNQVEDKEYRDTKSLMLGGKCTTDEWCPLCHFC